MFSSEPPKQEDHRIYFFVTCKPEPLGTEFKNIVDGMTGAMFWLEIQDVKENVRQREYTQYLGGTTACVTRGVTKRQISSIILTLI